MNLYLSGTPTKQANVSSIMPINSSIVGSSVLIAFAYNNISYKSQIR